MDAVHPCAAATACTISMILSWNLMNVLGLSARSVPCKLAESAMTLLAEPALNTVTLITTESNGSVNRLTSVCNAVTTALPATTTSTLLCGTAAWPPRPVMLTSKHPDPAMMVPPRVPIVPLGISGYGQLCNPNTLSSSGFIINNPVLPSLGANISLAPAPPSSAG